MTPSAKSKDTHERLANALDALPHGLARTRRRLVAGLVAGLSLAWVGGVSAQSPEADTPPKVATDRATDLATRLGRRLALAAGEAE